MIASTVHCSHLSCKAVIVYDEALMITHPRPDTPPHCVV